MRISYPWSVVLFRAIYEDPGNPKGREVTSHPVYPLEVAVERNSYREADTAKLTCDFQDQPIDPRLIKSLAISVHMGELSRAGEVPKPDDSTRQFVGFVDIPTMKFSDNGKTVSFEARDYTALLIDTKLGADMVDLRKPVHEVVKGLLAQEPCFSAIEVVTPGLETTPILAELKSDWNHKAASEMGESYWDKIVDLVQQAGLVCYIEKDKLVIEEAHSLILDADEKPQNYIEIFLYGRNLRELTIKRDLKKKQKANIEVRSYDDKQKRTLIGRYPKTPEAKAIVSGESSAEKVDTLIFPVSNINEQAHLDKIAKSIFEQFVREEVSGTIETNELKSIRAKGGKSLLSLHAGDAVFVGFHTEAGDMVDFHSMSTSARQGYLKSRGYDDQTAALFAELYETDKMYGPYYVHKATHRMEVNEGYSLSVDFINFFDPDQMLKTAKV